jgi:hypothetical protein
MKTQHLLRWIAPAVIAASAAAATFEVDYQPPPTGVTLAVSAPEPTTTPLVVFINNDGKVSTAAVLGTGLYRLGRLIANGRMHPKVASNPKAQALPSDAEFLVPTSGRVLFVIRSHDELSTGGPFIGYTTVSCATPFAFIPREGYRYKATYTKTETSCTLLVTERAAEPADAPETPLTSLELPAK